MQRLPASVAASTVLHRSPFAFAHNRQSRAVDDEMDGSARWDAAECNRERLTSSGERGVVWSGAARSTPINDKTDRQTPSAWRKGNRKTRRIVNAVSIAQSENFFGAPGRPDGDGRHASVAWRWCADADRPTRFKPSSPSPTDAVRDGSAKLGHPVQNVTREHGLTPLPR